MCNDYDKFLLYLDVLGFSEMVRDKNRVLSLYKIIDKLNVHRHHAFRCIIFSDTMLVYNSRDPSSDYDRRYLVMYLIEFAQDLLSRLIGRGLFFRAVLTRGEFIHSRFENLESFFGEALVEAFHAEKSIIGSGLYIESSLNRYNAIFKTSKHSDKYRFVFLTPHIDGLCMYGADGFPVPGELLDNANLQYQTYAELLYLKDIYERAIYEADPRIREKYQIVWFHYVKKYRCLCDVLCKSNFDLYSVSDADWQSAKDFYIKELESDYFKFSENDATHY